MEILEELSDLIENGAGIRVYENLEGDQALLFSSPLAPTITVDPSDALRFIIRPLVSWPDLSQQSTAPLFSLQDCRLRGIPAFGTFSNGVYTAHSLFDEIVVIQSANDMEQDVITHWEDYLSTLPEEDRAEIETHQNY